jgi:hypothetical protein
VRRIATSRARWWQQHGREAEARALSSGVFARFDEGFDTPDLVDAASLLEDLEPGLETRGVGGRSDRSR